MKPVPGHCAGCRVHSERIGADGSDSLAAAMKEYLQPVAAEVTKMEQFIATVMWGQLQTPDCAS